MIACDVPCIAVTERIPPLRSLGLGRWETKLPPQVDGGGGMSGVVAIAWAENGKNVDAVLPVRLPAK